ncbi:MAG: hypothetical protein ACRDX8_02305 [Acidimicrobiales bacterium]
MLVLQRLIGNRAVASLLSRAVSVPAAVPVQRELYLGGSDMAEASLPAPENLGKAERAGPGVVERLSEMLTDGIRHEFDDWPAAIVDAARQEGVVGAQFPPKRKWEADESDSDSEAEAVNNATKRRRIVDTPKAIFNATKSKARKGNIRTPKQNRRTKRKRDKSREVQRVDNWAKTALEVTKQQLSLDAKAIHQEALGGGSRRSFGATTVVTAALLDLHGTVQKFMFTNLKSMVSKALCDAAARRGYQSIAAQQSHAEGELIQYVRVARKGFYSIQAIGCDKDHCVECDEVLRKVIGNYETSLGVGSKPFKNYYIPEALGVAFGKNYTSQTDPADAKAMLRHDAEDSAATRKQKREERKRQRVEAPVQSGEDKEEEEEGD